MHDQRLEALYVRGLEREMYVQKVETHVGLLYACFLQ